MSTKGLSAALLTVKEAARILGRDPRTVTGWLKSGEVPRLGIRISGRVWVRREVLESLLRGEMDAQPHQSVTAQNG